MMKADFLAFFKIYDNENHIPIVNARTKNSDTKISSNDNSRQSQQLFCLFQILYVAVFRVSRLFAFLLFAH